MTNLGKFIVFCLCVLILAVLAILNHDMRTSIRAMEPKQTHELIATIDGMHVYADGFGGYFCE